MRTDKANFGPSPIAFIFSVKVNHYIQCINIAFICIFIFYETVFRVTSKLANLSGQTLKFCYKRRTLPKQSFSIKQAEYFICKSFIFPRYFNGLTILFCQICRRYEFSKIPPTKLRNVRSVIYLKLKAISSNVGPDLETNL